MILILNESVTYRHSRAQKDRSPGNNRVAQDNQPTFHNHDCFHLSITTYVHYMLHVATNELGRGVSSKQPCDNISILFATTYFTRVYSYILCNRICTNGNLLQHPISERTIVVHCPLTYMPVMLEYPLGNNDDVLLGPTATTNSQRDVPINSPIEVVQSQQQDSASRAQYENNKHSTTIAEYIGTSNGFANLVHSMPKVNLFLPLSSRIYSPPPHMPTIMPCESPYDPCESAIVVTSPPALFNFNEQPEFNAGQGTPHNMFDLQAPTASEAAILDIIRNSIYHTSNNLFDFMNLEHDCNTKASVMGITMTEFVCWGTSTASESEDRSESRKLSSTPGTAWYINCIPFYANSSWNYQAAACISICARISTILQLWTATILIVVVFILYLSIQRRRRTKSTCWVFGLASVGVLGVEQQSSYQQTTNIHNSEFLPQSSSLRFVSSPVLPT